MNKEKMLCLADYLETEVHDTNFDMMYWCNSKDQKVGLEDISEECGTTCCIAGWQQVSRNRKTINGGLVFDKKGTMLGCAKYLAQQDLGLTDHETQALFHREYWPRKFTNGLQIFENTPKGAAERIRYMVETGE